MEAVVLNIKKNCVMSLCKVINKCIEAPRKQGSSSSFKMHDTAIVFELIMGITSFSKTSQVASTVSNHVMNIKLTVLLYRT